MYKLSIWASGNGSNAENIFKFFENNQDIKIDHIICNNKNAVVFERASKLGLDIHYFSNSEFKDGKTVLNFLKSRDIDYIVLAGFLLKVSDEIINHYPSKILNLHPALLPNYGGKGMYGMAVHKAVIEANETRSGITIHIVDEEYDHGAIVFQSVCNIDKMETPESLAEKIHKLEYEYYPKVILNYILSAPTSNHSCNCGSCHC